MRLASFVVPNESLFHRVRGEVLQTALNRLEPRPLGRPPQQPSPQDQQVAQLEEENLRLQVELKAAVVRRHPQAGTRAEKLPRLAKSKESGKAAETVKKTTARERKRLRQRLQQNKNRRHP